MRRSSHSAEFYCFHYHESPNIEAQSPIDFSSMHIKDRTFIITGGSSGLGLATARELHSHGGYIAILDMNTDAGEEVVKELGSDRSRFFEVDVTDTDSIANALKGTSAWVKKTGRQIGGVVSAAGVGNPGKVRSQ